MTEAEWIAFLQRPEIPAFNRAMLVNPEDDLPRLVFADWMDETCPDTAVNKAVRESINKPDYHHEWDEQNKGGRRIWLRFTRGRVDADSLPARPLKADSPPRRLFDAVWRAGWVDSVRFGAAGEFRPTGTKALHHWINDPLLSQLTLLDISAEEATEADVRLLLDSPHLRIKSLIISGGGEQIRWLATLADRPILSQLRRLHLFMADLRTTEFETLMAAPRLSDLKELHLASCQLAERQAEVIASSPHLRALENLIVHPNRNIVAAALANSPYLCEAIRAQWRRSTDDGGVNS